ncbi:MAG: acetyltransferase [Deltaproteobacteria bacterium]|nr:MAG: acetyltransferase [Deltaproteobacteria bacterium]
MRKDRRPYGVKKAYLKLQAFYTRRYIRPQFQSFGKGHNFMKPWYVEIFGEPIRLGDCATVIATPDKRVRLSIWSGDTAIRGIDIGNHCLICPGVRISAATEVVIGDNCMLASGAYITDSDWHGIYDRSLPIGTSKPVHLAPNVWLGDSAIVCKGVSIGENSIIGAGAVVVGDIPPNVIAAGNPARVIRELDPDAAFKTRGDWCADPDRIYNDFDIMDMEILKENSLFTWLRSVFFPTIHD